MPLPVKPIFLPCEYCPAGTEWSPEVAICRECKMILYITCPHDGFDEETKRCSSCTDRIFAETVTCGFHRTIMHYFCLDCGKGVCNGCLSEGHSGHRFQRLGILYDQKLKQIRCMLDNLSITIGSTAEVKRQVQRNLELVEANEQDLITELEALLESAKQKVWASAAQRKRELRAKLQMDFQTPRDKIERTVYTLSKYELIQHHPALMQTLTNEMARCYRFSHHEVEPYGFSCLLIPKMALITIRIENITNGKTPTHLEITDSSGYYWAVKISTNPKVTVQLSAKDDLLESLPHRLVLEILHRDLTKTLRRSCIFMHRSEELELAELEYLRVNGFLRRNNVITMRIGIRASSLIVENEMLKLKLGKKQLTPPSVVKKHHSSQENVCSSSFFHMRLAGKCGRVQSDPITDYFGRRWCLRVKQVTTFIRSKSRTMLGVYVVQMDGARCRCEYFIILHNKDDSKRFVASGVEEFLPTEQNFGKNACIDVADLTETSGFLFDGGMLRFQFGVTPITANSGIVIEVAHFDEFNKLVTKTILQ